MEAPNVTTLLFTDIEGSTRLWEREGERMSRALAEHDAVSRSAVEEHRGAIIKMTGDGICAAFDDPVDALKATAQLQRSLATLASSNKISLRVRAGLHLGIVERRNEDLFGSSVNRAARIMKAAHGGQILVSQAVFDHVRTRLPPPISLRDLGGVRLRDLATSEHVYQVVHPELRQDFPALRSLEATPNNLPQQVTSFIGRERELADAKRLLESTRLLTLLGMGGLGKTRLSLQIAADVLEKYPDGVWFVDLASIKDPALVPSAAAQAMGVHEEPGRSLTQTLCTHVRELKLLIVLDNCEHLVSACAHLAEALLSAAPEVRILATSREALHIRGEQTYGVLPLAVPDRKADVEALMRSEAVQLLVERARLQKATFSVTERDAPGIAELCSRLEGIPLALELAAARLRSMSVSDINARLHDRFKLLTGGSRAALERQQTLRALVSWSYDLLDEREQIVLDRLSVFAAGFDLEAAEAVCGAHPIPAEDVLDLVTSLVDKSLVMVEQTGDASRYGLLETIREFALEHLKKRYGLLGTIKEFAQERLQERDDLAATAARHSAYYLVVAKTARIKLLGPEQAEWIRRLEIDLDNLRAAITFALSGGGDPVNAVKFEVALMRFRELRGYSTEGRNNVNAALALPALLGATVGRAHALYVGGVLALNLSDHAESEKMLDECLEIRRGLGNPVEVAAALSTLATLHVQQRDTDKARDCEEEAIAIFRKLGDEIGEGIGLSTLAEISVRQGDYDAAQKFFEQSRAIALKVKHLELESECERNLGDLALRSGEVQAAQTWFARSFALCQKAEDRRGEAIVRGRQGRIALVRGDLEHARAQLADAMRALRNFEMRSELLDCLDDFAQLLQRMGQITEAVGLFGAVAANRETLRLPRSSDEQARAQASLHAARGSVAQSDFDAAWSMGRSWTLDKAVDHVLGLPAAQPVTA